MAQIDANRLIVTRCEGLIEAEVGGELMGLNIANGTCYGFNPTATRVWQIIERPRTLAEICAVLTREFSVDAATCEAEVRALLDDLAGDGIVRLS
ncbi:PqqD family protein [Sphingomonas canadensis]|uniref:PqqD family protein n=1 Tax=Sphingomonas canadensis TaxID=1219257 RepID=A0ABW3HB09_9SPHN|nr:PqqD family protein [Sphingomonas canadensis]MCW3838432.1 PqqD family protein [Sphingomonas canadensis]